MPSKNANTTTSLPSQIEIFRAGTHTDDSGVAHHFSEADVAAMVAAYNPKLHEAPLTIGHPAHDLPAYGWVKGVALNAAQTVVMDTHQVQARFAEMVAGKMFKKRSLSLYPKNHPNNPVPGVWYPRHVAFLGAQPAAIKGLADFAEAGTSGCANFADGDATGTVSFSEDDPLFNQEQIRMTKELQDQLAASQAQAAIADAARTKAEGEAAAANAKLAQFAETAHRERVAGFVSFCDAQIKTGCLLPKEKDAAVAVMTTLADSKEVSFAEGGATKTIAAVDWLKGLIERSKPVVNFGEYAAGTAPLAGSAAGLSEADVDQKVRAYAQQHKVQYAEALSVVVGFTS